MKSLALAAVLILLPAAAFSAPEVLRGHSLRVFSTDNDSISWVAQDDIADAERTVDAKGQSVLRVHLKPEAATRLQALTRDSVGKKIRFTWDGATISDMTVQGSFGERFDLKAPPQFQR